MNYRYEKFILAKNMGMFLCLKYEDWWSQVTYQVLFSEAMDRFSNIEPFLLAKGVLWPLVPNNYILLSTPPHWIWTTCWILHWKVPKLTNANVLIINCFCHLQAYKPTAFEKSTSSAMVAGRRLKYTIWDTTGNLPFFYSFTTLISF